MVISSALFVIRVSIAGRSVRPKTAVRKSLFPKNSNIYKFLGSTMLQVLRGKECWSMKTKEPSLGTFADPFNHTIDHSSLSAQ